MLVKMPPLLFLAALCRGGIYPSLSGKGQRLHSRTRGRHKCLPQLVKKASQSLPPLAANRVQSVFCRGAPQGGLSCSFGAIHLLYLAENTSQTASVEFVPHRGANYARSRLPEFVGNAQRGFSTVSGRHKCLPYCVSPFLHGSFFQGWLFSLYFTLCLY